MASMRRSVHGSSSPSSSGIARKTANEHWVDSPPNHYARMTDRDTLPGMTRAISVRLDDQALHALGLLEATGMTRSEAIRAALVETASRRQEKQAIAAEVAALEADDDDRAEMLAVANVMESLRAAG